MPDAFSLLLPAFIAGLLTFLAPCTLPLLPAYLGFISGASAKEFQNPTFRQSIRRHVFFNGLFYVVGFSSVFILLGILFGLGGAVLIGYQDVLQKIGGVFVLFFGLYMLGVFERIPRLHTFLLKERRFAFVHSLKPGKPSSSFILGATFAFGWTPCVGPVLGSILLLASSTATVIQGAILLAVFSLGLAIPFLLLAFGVGHAGEFLKKLTHILPYISILGGLLLLILGMLLLTDSLSIWLNWSYRVFEFFEYDRLLDYL